MKRWLEVALTVVLSLLGAGVIYLASSQPRGVPIQLLPPPTNAPFQVHVAGAVKIPGVYTFTTTDQVEDAINAAGGFKDEADIQAINLAEPLQDGIQIRVPFLTQNQESNNSFENQGSNDGQRFLSITGLLININTASQEELETLPEIGPVIAESIIEYRQTKGLFSSIEEIQKVDRIGPVTFELIKELITVKNP